MSNYLFTEILVDVPDSGSFTVQSGSIPPEYTQHYISVGYYGDPNFEEFIQPTAGTVTVEITDDGNQWGGITNGVIDLTKADYSRPNCSDRLAAVRIHVLGVTPASSNHFFKAAIHSYK